MNKNEKIITDTGHFSTQTVLDAAKQYQTPFYIYDESILLQKCDQMLSMPNAFGLDVRYAMKANSSKALLQLVTKRGLDLDISSMNEGRRAHLAGIPYNRMMLTTQEIPIDKDRRDLEVMAKAGLKYNVCSFRQLEMIADFAAFNQIPLSIRINPGVGSGESMTRNTGDKYSSFGIFYSDIEQALEYAHQKNIIFDQVHVHIGSGGDPDSWQENIDRELLFVEKYFPDVKTVNLGGGFKEARMPTETAANIEELGSYAKKRFNEFYQKTGRKLFMEIEPGTFIVANAGFLVTRVMDIKQTGKGGFQFLVLDGGMEANTRPLIYGSQHPFYLVSKNGELLSAEYDLSHLDKKKDQRVIAGKCCETGDTQSIDASGNIVPRLIANPDFDDFLIIGGVGAYCASMSPFNYNSHTQIPELLLRDDGQIITIREPQTVEQMIENERSL